MGKVIPLTDEERAEILRLHGEGLSRNEIARRIGRGGKVVSKVVAEDGGSFERAEWTAKATETRAADLAARRARLAELLQSDAERLREQMWEPATIYNFGGKDNTYSWEQVPEPPAGDKRALMATAATAIDRSMKLLPPDPGDGSDDARSMLGQLAAGLQAAYDTMQRAPAEGDGDAP